MKILKISHIFIAILLCYNACLHSMVLPSDFQFLKWSLGDIYNFVQDLSYANGKEYRILSNNMLFIGYAKTLGLKPTNTLLDVPYHFLLLQQRLGHGPAYNHVVAAYNSLMQMLFEIDDYDFQKEFQVMMYMPLAEVEALELKDIKYPALFLQEKKALIKKTVHSLKEISKQVPQLQVPQQQEYYKKETIQVLLGLPEYASPGLIEAAYKSYMEQHPADKWIAQQKVGKISLKTLKNKLAEIEDIKRAYNEYVQSSKS